MRVAVIAMSVAAVAGLASAALGSGGGAPANRVAVALADASIVTDRATVPAGKVTFDARNTGTVEHELLVVRTDLAPDALPVGLNGPNVDLAGETVLGTPHTHGDHGAQTAGRGAARLGESRHVPPGGARRETVRLEAGRYVLLCSLPGHYAAGQRAGLVVTVPAGTG